MPSGKRNPTSAAGKNAAKKTSNKGTFSSRGTFSKQTAGKTLTTEKTPAARRTPSARQTAAKTTTTKQATTAKRTPSARPTVHPPRVKGGSPVNVGLDPTKYAAEIDRYISDIASKIKESLTVRLTKHAGMRHLPDTEQVAAAVVDLIDETQPNELAAVVGPFWSAAKVRDELGVPTRQALESRRKSGTLLGVKTSDGKVIYPLSQFRRRHGVVEVKPGLKPLLSALRDQPPWSVAVLLSTPAQELEGMTPLEWERKHGDPARLADLARTVKAEWR